MPYGFHIILMVFSGITRCGVWNPACQPHALMRERPMPTDTTLTIRCPYCVVGIEFTPMIAHKDGRFVCRDCAHTVLPGEPEHGCICRTCMRLARKPLLPDHGSRFLTQ